MSRAVAKRGRVPLITYRWAFLDLTEEGVSKGGVGGEGETLGTYALFADVAKSYGQVWRDGLYLTLYSMGAYGCHVAHN